VEKTWYLNGSKSQLIRHWKGTRKGEELRLSLVSCREVRCDGTGNNDIGGRKLTDSGKESEENSTDESSSRVW
jgi:hypothetical protein